ncbi:MAG: GNAT family N-acetyltransferase [Mycobacteriales bacterium]
MSESASDAPAGTGRAGTQQPGTVRTSRVFTTAEASRAELRAIRQLCLQAFSGDFSDEDWANAQGGWHVVVSIDGERLAHAAVVPRILHAAGRPLRVGYVEAVGTMPGHEGAGLGSLAMAEIETLLNQEFEMGALSTGSHEFYARLGWERWRGPTFVRDGASLTRSADDDDGVMVLRYGPSRDVDLSAPLACEGRAGEDW